jgi:hypothetical protein
MMTKKTKISSKNRGAGPARKRGDSPASAKTKKKRGGQSGNNNALKHGFYSRLYKEREKKILTQLPPTALQGEIDLARVNNRHVLEALINTPGLTFEQKISAARVISFGNANIASLTRTQFQTARFTSDASETEEWFKKLLAALPPDETDQESH